VGRTADALLPRAAHQPPHQRRLRRAAAGVGGAGGQGRLTIRTVTALEWPASSTTARRISPAPSGIHFVPSSGLPSTSQRRRPTPPAAASATGSCAPSSSRASGGG